jgi:outer membrane protein TolC
MNFDFKNVNKVVGMGLIVSVLSSCAVDKKPISDAEISWKLSKDLEKTFTMQEPIKGDIDIYQAMARALKYNLNNKIEKLEQAIELDNSNIPTYQMLPNIAAKAGYSAKSEKLVYDGKAVDGSGSTFKPTVFEQRNKALSELEISWNVLDFGVGYVNAKQQKDKIFIAQEVRRKAIQNIVYEVRKAYWKALAAQKTEKDINALIDEVKVAIKDSNIVSDLQNEKESLLYQKDLLAQLQKLNNIKKEIVTAKYELAALMNVDPALDFRLANDNNKENLNSGLSLPIRELETIALIKRPEVKISKYDVRISREEIDKELLRLLPGIEFSSSLNYDSNKYLKNQSWADAGLQVSFNLINTIMGNDNIDIAKSKYELEKAKSLALNVAILTQVNVSYAKLKEAKNGYDLSNQYQDVCSKLYKHQVYGSEKRLDMIKNKVNLVNSYLAKEYAYSQYQDADSRLYHAIGVDPVPEVTTNSSVDLISNILRQTVGKWNNIEFRKRKIEEIKEEILKYKNGKHKPVEVNIDSSWTNNSNWLDNTVKNDEINISVEEIDFVNPEKLDLIKKNEEQNKTVPLNLTKKVIKKYVKGEYLQLGAYVYENNVYKDWKKIISKHGFLKKYTPEIRRATINGVSYHRMMIKDNKSEIKRLYKLLKSSNTDCIVR